MGLKILIKTLLPYMIFSAAALSLPLYAVSYWTFVFTVAWYFAILAVTWNLLAGYTGLFSLGHVAIATLGAYASAALFIGLNLPEPVGILAGAGFGAVLGLGLGTLTLRMKGVYLALTTLAFSEIARRILLVEYETTRGALGLWIPKLAATEPYYYSMFGLLIVTLFVSRRLLNSPTGLFLKSIREDEGAAEVMGINTAGRKLLVFVVSSALAGAAGALYGHFVGVISPRSMELLQMGLVIAMTVIGGMGTFAGPVIGAVLLQFLNEYLRGYDVYRMVIYGIAIFVILRFFRGGLDGAIRGLYKKLIAPYLLRSMRPRGHFKAPISRISRNPEDKPKV